MTLAHRWRPSIHGPLIHPLESAVWRILCFITNKQLGRQGAKPSYQCNFILQDKSLPKLWATLTTYGATEVLPRSACLVALDQFREAGRSLPALLVVQVRVHLHRESYVRMPQSISDDLRCHSPKGQRARVAVASLGKPC